MDDSDLKLSMEQSLANKFERQLKEEKERRQFAEAELALIKGIGQNSPEQKALQKEVQKLKKELEETKNDNKKLADQVNNQIDQLRKSGVI
jgi:hypothetical protein